MSDKPKTVPKEIWFELKTEEVVTRAQRVAAIRKEVDAVLVEKKKSTDDFKAAANVLESEQTRLLNTIRANGEHRTVDCEMVKNFNENKVEYYYEGKLVEERAMNFQERQLEMGIVDTSEEEGPEETKQAEVIPINPHFAPDTSAPVVPA